MSKEIAQTLGGKRIAWLVTILAAVALLGTLGANWLSETASAAVPAGTYTLTQNPSSGNVNPGGTVTYTLKGTDVNGTTVAAVDAFVNVDNGLTVTDVTCDGSMGNGTPTETITDPAECSWASAWNATGDSFTMTVTATAPLTGTVDAPTADIEGANDGTYDVIDVPQAGLGINPAATFTPNEKTEAVGQTIVVTVDAVGSTEICDVTVDNPGDVISSLDPASPFPSNTTKVVVSLTGTAVTSTTLTATVSLDTDDCEFGTTDTVLSGVYEWNTLAVLGAELVHWDVDAASEDAAGNNDGFLDTFHDSDDATGSLHRVCVISDYKDFGDADLFWFDVITSAGDADEHNFGVVEGPNGELCYEWSSARTGSQTISAWYEPTAETIYWDGAGGSQPLIKEWNTIDDTKIVSVSGDVGQTLGDNTGELANWTSAPSGECVRDDDASASDSDCVDRPDQDGATTEVAGVLVTVGRNQGFVYTPARPSFIEYVSGSHENYDGPIDGAQQTFTLDGDCGSILLEDPVTGQAIPLDQWTKWSDTVLSSDKGVAFQVFPTDDSTAPTDANDPNLDCWPGDETIIEITTREDIQLRSDLDGAPKETITIVWTVPPPTNKQPILAWAGQRVVLEHDWSLPGPKGPVCPAWWLRHADRIGSLVDAMTVESSFHVLYQKQAQGPGAFSADIGTWPGGDYILSPDAALVEVLPDTFDSEIDREWPNTWCVSTVMYESQDPGEVDVSAYVVDPYGYLEGWDGPPLQLPANLSWLQPLSNEVDFLIYYMKFESLELGIVEGSRADHNAGDFTRSGGNHPFDASKDVEETTANVSADVLVRARVKGWFLNANLTDRPAETRDGFTLPAGRWVMPDDWQKLAGGDLAMVLRPNYDIMIDPMGSSGCTTPTRCTAKQGDLTGKTYGQDDVAGPFSLVDGPLNDDGLAPGAFYTWPFRDTWLQDGAINEADAPMPPAQLTFQRSGAGVLKEAHKFDVQTTNPFYLTHIPAEPWITWFTADGQGYLWNSWWADSEYPFWTPAGNANDAADITVYTDNHGEAMVWVNGDDADVPGAGSLTFDECNDADSLSANGIASLSGYYCEEGDLVGSTDITAKVDYPDKRKHQPIGGNTVAIDWEWGGYKVVTIEDGEDDQFKYVVIHVKDRDGYCADSPSLHPVIGEDVEFILDVIGGGRIVGVSNNGTIGLLGQDAATTLAEADATDGIADIEADECQAWIKVSNSLLGVTDVLVTAYDPEGTPTFDRIVDFSTSVEYTLHFRWTLITWPGEDGIAVGDAIASVVDDVTAVYGWDADAQVWLAYFPDGVGVPGANDLATLTQGDAYWIAIGGPDDVTWEIAVNVD